MLNKEPLEQWSYSFDVLAEETESGSIITRLRAVYSDTRGVVSDGQGTAEQLERS